MILLEFCNAATRWCNWLCIGWAHVLLQPRSQHLAAPVQSLSRPHSTTHSTSITDAPLQLRTGQSPGFSAGNSNAVIRSATHSTRTEILLLSAVSSYTSSAAIAERPRCMGGLVMAKSGRLKLGDNIYGYYKSIFNFNHCDVFGQQSNRNPWKAQKAITPFTVIQGQRCRYQSKARTRLPISE